MTTSSRYIWPLVFAVLVSETPSLNATPQDENALHEVEEIIVSATRNRQSFAQQATRVEVLGGDEINEKANMKPGDIRMLLNETTGIHIQQKSKT